MERLTSVKIRPESHLDTSIGRLEWKLLRVSPCCPAEARRRLSMPRTCGQAAVSAPRRATASAYG
jgi:hypothetical protein